MESPSTTAKALRKSPIQVLFCCNPDFYQHLAVTLVSMLDSNPQTRFDSHVITSSRDQPRLEKLLGSVEGYPNLSLTIHDFSLKDYAHFFVDQHITLESYLRIFAAEILSAEIDKILYLDCDLVVLGDLRELWAVDINGYVLGGAIDPYALFRREALGIPADRPYVNCGVLLLNLVKWRTEKISERLVRYIEAHGNDLTFHDQDAMNAVLHHGILTLDYKWNVQAGMYRVGPQPYPRADSAIREARRRPAIIHYSSGEKPWIFRAIVAKKWLYFRHLGKTKWRGTKPIGIHWYTLPEFFICRALDYLGFDYMLIIRALRRFGRALTGWAQRISKPIRFSRLKFYTMKQIHQPRALED